MSFRGESRHSLDAKSRFIMPIKFREELGESIILTRGLDTCLFGFTVQEYTAIEDKVKSKPITNESVRRFARFFLGAADEKPFDSHGRVVITPSLRQHAQITKEIVCIGLGNRIEIWAADKWDEYSRQNNIDAELAAPMADLGI